MSPRAQPVGVLFVCHANMCRSPLAEGIFRHLAQARGMLDDLHIESAGTDAIEGCDPHPRSREIAAAHGITLTGTGRQLIRHDLSNFDHVVVMDRRNYDKISRLAAPSAFGELQGFRARLRMLRAIANPKASGQALDVPDPIGRGPEQYAEVYELIAAGCTALLDEIASAPDR